MNKPQQTQVIKEEDMKNIEGLRLNAEIEGLTDEQIIINDSLIEDLRNTDTTINIEGTTKEFISLDKELTIYNTNDYLKIKLTSDYLKYVLAGKDILIAEFDIKNTTKENIFDNIEYYDKKNNLNKINKTFWTKYGIDWNDTECNIKVGKNNKEEVVCENVLKTNWTLFSNTKEIPKGITKVGLFTEVKAGDKIEWIPTINNIKIYEFAEFDAISNWNTGINLANVGDIAIDFTTNTHIWIADGYGDDIYKFWINGTSAGTFSMASKYWNGIYEKDNYLYILDGDYGDDEVYKYFKNGTATGVHWDISSAGSSANGLAYYNHYFYVLDDGADEVYIYFENGTYTGNHWDTAGSGAGAVEGITTNGTFFWIIDSTDDEVYKYWFNGTYTNIHFDTAGSSVTTPLGIANNGTHFFVNDGDDSVYIYDMGIPTADTTPPYFNNISGTNVDNTTISANTSISFSVISDNKALQTNGRYILSTNSTGVWTNNTAKAYDETNGTIAYDYIIVNDTVDTIIGYNLYFWDNEYNNASTSVYTFVTTAPEQAQTSCATYNNGEWYIPNGCECYCDNSANGLLDLSKCSCVAI